MKAKDRILGMLTLFIHSARDEIERLRHLELGQTGADPGLARAESLWFERHYTTWRARQWHLAVEQALKNADTLPRTIGRAE